MAIAQAVLDRLWDFGDPAGSEARLRRAAAEEPDAATRAELDTQVARALGLQERFAEADAALDAVSSGPSAADPAVAARVLLERGRVLNSSGDPVAAVPLFRDAADRAAAAGLAFLELDALHMLAIADPDRGAEWTAAALGVLERIDDPRTLRWTVSLHNNEGWRHFDAGRFAESVAAFEQARDAATHWGTRQQLQWADEALAEARAALTARASQP